MITKTHIMVDLETLGRGPGCRILSIGAAVLVSNMALPDLTEFYLELDPNNQPGLAIDPETWDWWQNQDAAVRDRLFKDEPRPGLAEALKKFAEYLETMGGRDAKGDLRVCIWGNGSDFDNAILQYAYRAVGLPVPWPFWNNRCYRTLKALAPSLKIERQGSHHNALDDARSQAIHTHALFTYLGLSWHGL